MQYFLIDLIKIYLIYLIELNFHVFYIQTQ